MPPLLRRRHHCRAAAILRQVCSDERFEDLRFAITDYRDVEVYETSPQAIEETAALHIAPLLTNPKILLASVATDERVVAAIQHFISLDFISQPYQVFPTMEEARAWIENAHMATRPRIRNAPEGSVSSSGAWHQVDHRR